MNVNTKKINCIILLLKLQVDYLFLNKITIKSKELFSVLFCFEECGSSGIWYQYQTSQLVGQDYKVFHSFDYEDERVASTYEARYDG